MRTLSLAASLVVSVFLITPTTHAWTSPPASPPNSNVSAPINVGATTQVKNGNMGMNTLTAYGDGRFVAGWAPTPSTITYLNFSNIQYPAVPVWGSSGYGIRDSNGTLEFKNSGGEPGEQFQAPHVNSTDVTQPT